MKSFRELRVWQRGMDLVETVYLLARDFPKQDVWAYEPSSARGHFNSF